MRPDDRDIDEEIRGHLAINIKERIDRGEDPETARLAAMREFAYLPHVREQMRQVWYSRWFDLAEALAQDIRVGMRSLWRAKGLPATVVITLALGIGANAAIFSVVRGVLLRPLVNRGEDRLIYIQQSAPGVGSPNITFSLPEIKDIRARATTVENFGEFSTVEFNLVGLGDPRVVESGVVDGRYFEVVGLRAQLGRLIEPSDDGPNHRTLEICRWLSQACGMVRHGAGCFCRGRFDEALSKDQFELIIRDDTNGSPEGSLVRRAVYFL